MSKESTIVIIGSGGLAAAAAVAAAPQQDLGLPTTRSSAVPKGGRSTPRSPPALRIVLVGSHTSVSLSNKNKPKKKEDYGIRGVNAPSLVSPVASMVSSTENSRSIGHDKRMSIKKVICPGCTQELDQSHFSVNQWSKLRPVCKHCIHKND